MLVALGAGASVAPFIRGAAGQSAMIDRTAMGDVNVECTLRNVLPTCTSARFALRGVSLGDGSVCLRVVERAKSRMLTAMIELQL